MTVGKELTKVAGRNPVLTVQYVDGDTVHKIGDTIFWQSNLYEVVGIMWNKLLTAPPKVGSVAGLELKLVR